MSGARSLMSKAATQDTCPLCAWSVRTAIPVIISHAVTQPVLSPVITMGLRAALEEENVDIEVMAPAQVIPVGGRAWAVTHTSRKARRRVTVYS